MDKFVVRTPSVLILTIEKALQKFKLKSFRPLQKEIIDASLQKKDILVLMNTGSGKSLTFQLPAIITHGITIIISPLLALIQNQIQELQNLGIKASSINSTTTKKQKDLIIKDILKKTTKVKLLYVTPELLSTSDFRTVLDQIWKNDMFARLVVDECHLIEQWGNTFRNTFKNLDYFRKSYPDLPIIALTATATQQVVDEVTNCLGMKDPVVFRGNVERTNLYLEVRFKGLDNDPTEDVLKFLKKVYSNRQKRLQEAKSEDEPSAKERIKGICGIIYCSTREKCESVTKTLKAHSINAATYHAGLKQSERQKILNNWSKTTSETPQVQSSRPSVTQASLAFQPASSLTQAKSQSSAFQPASTLTKTKQYITKNHPLTIPPVDDEVIDIVVATISFGMGIDKKQVRFIIHWELPQSLEGYYQESGRAGRDGKTSRCILYYSKPDVDRILYLQSLNQKEQKMSKEKKSFEKLVEYCETTSICRHQFITQYFTSKSTQPCKENCDICKEQAKVKKRKLEYDYNVRNNTQYGENTFTKLEEFGSMGYMSAKNRQGDVRLKDGSLVTFGSTKREYDEFLQGDEEENYGFQKAGDVYNREYLFGRKDKDKPKTSLIEKFTYPLFNQKRVVQGLGASKREKIYLKIKDIVETKIIHEIDGNVQKDLAIEFEGQLFMASGLLVVYDTKSNSFLRKIMALEPAPINELAEIIKKLFQ